MGERWGGGGTGGVSAATPLHLSGLVELEHGGADSVDLAVLPLQQQAGKGGLRLENVVPGQSTGLREEGAQLLQRGGIGHEMAGVSEAEPP